MARKKILIIDNSVHITGALKSIVATSLDLSTEFEFVFVLPADSHAISWIRAKGFRLYQIPFLELSKAPKSVFLYLPALLRNALALKKIIRDERIDLVHGNDLYNLTSLVASLFGASVPIITHIRFLPDKFPRVLFRTWIGLHIWFANRVVSVSNYLASRLPDHPKVIVIHDRLPQGAAEQMVSLKKNSHPTLLYVANVIQGKGHNYAIEMFSILGKEFPDWRIKFVGGDMGLEKNRTYKDILMARCIDRGIDAQTLWCDFTNDVASEYQSADIALNFSDSESFSLTTLEALFFGCPIIATACGGPSEIIDHGQTGFLVPPGDIPSMVASVRILMEDKELRNRFAVEGPKSVRRKFGWENTSGKLLEIYKSALLQTRGEKND